MKKEEFKSQIEENAFKYLSERMADIMLDEIPSEQELLKTISFSETFDKKMEKLFKQERKKEFSKKILLISKRVAVFGIIIIVALGIAAFSVQAIRIKILNFFVDIKEEYTSFRKDEQNSDHDNNESDQSVLIGSYLFNYIPKGFELVESISTNLMTRAKFSNNDLFINFRVSKETSNVSLDTENTRVEKIDIDEKKCSYIERDNDNYILWYDNNMVISLSGNISKDELIEIIKKIEKN